MAIGWQQILIVLVLALLIFGGSARLPSAMRELAKAIKAFRDGLRNDDEMIEDQASAASDAPPTKNADKTDLSTTSE